MNSASAMNVLGKVCLLEYNDEIIESGLEETAYEALVKVLTRAGCQGRFSSL